VNKAVVDNKDSKPNHSQYNLPTALLQKSAGSTLNLLLQKLKWLERTRKGGTSTREDYEKASEGMHGSIEHRIDNKRKMHF